LGRGTRRAKDGDAEIGEPTRRQRLARSRNRIRRAPLIASSNSSPHKSGTRTPRRAPARVESDPDNPELTDERIAGLRPFAEVPPALAESVKRGPGWPKLDKTLEPVTLRLDRTTVQHFRALGADCRKRMARVLAKAAS
jgi:uncharacterized protein (DUF4415 family)